MTISLTVERVDGGRATGPHRYRFDREEVLVGRDRATDVRLPDPAISMVHLRLVCKKGRLYVVDNRSTNGTFLDGERVEPGKARAAGEGSRLRLGPFRIVLGEPAESVPLTAPSDTARLARQMVLEMIGAPGGGAHPVLEVQNGEDRGRRLALPPLRGPLVAGRGEGCALRLSDGDASRRHFEVENKGEAVELRDLGSKNGVERNGERIEGVVALAHGDELRVGQTVILYSDPAEAALHEIDDAPDEPFAGASSEPRLERSELTASGGIADAGASGSLSGVPVRWSAGSLLLVAAVALVAVAAMAGALWLLL